VTDLQIFFQRVSKFKLVQPLLDVVNNSYIEGQTSKRQEQYHLDLREGKCLAACDWTDQSRKFFVSTKWDICPRSACFWSGEEDWSSHH